MATETVREQLLVELERRAQGMNSGAGYFYDWAGCGRWRVVLPTAVGVPYASLIDLREEATKDEANRIPRMLRGVFVGWHRVGYSRDDGPATAATRMIGDFERLIWADRTIAGLAVDAWITGSGVDVSEAQTPIVTVEVEWLVMYRTTLTEPAGAV